MTLSPLLFDERISVMRWLQTMLSDATCYGLAVPQCEHLLPRSLVVPQVGQTQARRRK
jgi:hypothetical protein